MTSIKERKKQREKIFIYLYSIDNKTDFNIKKKDFEEQVLYEDQREYALKLLDSIENNYEDIDMIIKKYLKNWRFERIGDIPRAILRLAIAEILYVDEIDQGVAINEAVNLTKKYSDENKAKFVNGILGAFVRDN